MAYVVTVMNMKGGVGKTTVAMHLAGVIALRRVRSEYHRVLVIDYDPQFNLSQSYLKAEKYLELEKAGKTCLSILNDDDSAINPWHLNVPGSDEPPSVTDLATKVYPRLDLVPSTLDLMYLALGQTEKRTTLYEERFRKFITECRDQYDLILIDCHPAGSILTKTSLSNSDHVLIPVAPQRYALRGVALMLNFIRATKSTTGGPTAHILFNMTTSDGPSPEETVIRGTPRFTGKCLARTLRTSKHFEKPYGGEGFAWHSGLAWSKSAVTAVWHVAEELYTRMEGR